MKRKIESLSDQLAHKHAKEPVIVQTPEYEGSDIVISTGSTLLDLAISGGRFPEGGIPLGILVEVFGPSGAGKTVLLCQIAGNLQRVGGKVMFHDPEARLNKQFAAMFGLTPEEIDYTVPNTIPQVFQSVREWVPKKSTHATYGVFADSLAALSTDLEMDNKEGDKMGMRRAKEFSEELRKTCRIITQHNVLMVCSNQIRQNLDAGPYGQKHVSPGGEAIGFYSSLRLRCSGASKIKVKKSVRGKEQTRVTGVKTTIEVFKSSVWKPYRSADVYILFDYGIDDIQANLRFLKTHSTGTVYTLRDEPLGKSMSEAIRAIEDGDLEDVLKQETIKLWHEIEAGFAEERKPRS